MSNRKIILICVVLFIVVALGHAIWDQVRPAYFPDPALMKAAQRYIEVDERSHEERTIVYVRELARQRGVDLVNLGISDLHGIEQFKNVEELDVSGNYLVNLAPLIKLKKLKSLLASNNPIHDIQPLSKMKRLESLVIGKAQIDNLAPLEGLRQIKFLVLNNNKISDLKPLAMYMALEHLDLSDNQISDLCPLQSLVPLLRVRLANNLIKDIRPIRGWENVEELDLSYNQISDCSALGGMKNLDRVNLSGNLISEVSAFSELWIHDVYPLLIDLSHNQIEDITPLARTKSLYLLFYECSRLNDSSSREPGGVCHRISDPDGLEGLMDIGEPSIGGVYFDLSANQIGDLGQLATTMPNCSKLQVFGYKINCGITLNLTDNPLSKEALESQIPTLERKGIIIVR